MDKNDMKEFIYDMLRSINCKAGQGITKREFDNKVGKLPPKDRQLAIETVNELIDNGLLTYDGDGRPISMIKFTDSGFDEAYIQSPDSYIEELIFEEFRGINARANDCVMMRTIFYKIVPLLNPKDQSNFETVANRLIMQGYITADNDEQGNTHALRLTDKGFDYIWR